MNVCRTHRATNEIDALSMKHRKIWQDIAYFEQLLANDMTHNHARYPGLRITRGEGPASIWKARVAVEGMGGTGGGVRYVYERLTVESTEFAIALTVYLHQERGNDERIVIDRIRERCALFEASMSSLRTLDHSRAG